MAADVSFPLGSLHRLSDGSQAVNPALPHVLLVVDTFPKALGGGERVVLRLAALLPRYGFRVSLLTFSMDPESSFQPEQSPCPLYLLPLVKTYDLHALQAAFALRTLLREQKIVLVQTFFESSDLWAGAVVRLLSSAKLVWSRRDLGILRGRKHQFAYRWLRRLPHAVHTVSEGVRRHALTVDRIPPQRAFTVYNGLDLERFTPDPTPSTQKQTVILTVGNIRRVKGHDVLLHAAALLRETEPEAQFAVAGEVLEPSYFQELLDLRCQLGLQESFTFLGGVSDLATLLQKATIFVLPSRSEGFSNSLLEAMACGLPVVATDVGGNAEAVKSGITGVIVPAEDPRALAQALRQLLLSTAERLAMGVAGRHRAEELFSVPAMMRHLTGAYHDLLNGHGVTSSDYQR